MALTSVQKEEIQQVITKCLRQKFKKYKPKNNSMPFHTRLLGKDRMALYSFMQSLLTTFGTSIFEPVAAALAKTKFSTVETQYVVGNTIDKGCQQTIQEIINKLTYNPKPNKLKELAALKENFLGQTNRLKPIKVDLFVKTKEGDMYMFDLKTVKPNKGDFQKYKQTFLEWAGIIYTQDKNAKVHTSLAIPYNPYEPEPYKSWTMAGMLDIKAELKVAEDFWDFLGGKGAYNDLLDCFEKSGIELRTEIDNYFAKFKNN